MTCSSDTRARESATVATTPPRAPGGGCREPLTSLLALTPPRTAARQGSVSSGTTSTPWLPPRAAERALALDPLARYHRALLLFDVGRSADATAELEETLRLTPGYAPVRRLRERVLSGSATTRPH